MTTETHTELERLASEMSEAFETRTRDNGETFYCLRDGSPEWMADVCYEAHGSGDMMPDDWRYGVVAAAVESLSEDEDTDPGEFADGMVDVYTAARIRWLASDMSRAEYVDDAADDLGDSGAGIIDRLGFGQYREAEEVFDLVRSALEDEAARRQDV